MAKAAEMKKLQSEYDEVKKSLDAKWVEYKRLKKATDDAYALMGPEFKKRDALRAAMRPVCAHPKKLKHVYVLPPTPLPPPTLPPLPPLLMAAQRVLLLSAITRRDKTTMGRTIMNVRTVDKNLEAADPPDTAINTVPYLFSLLPIVALFVCTQTIYECLLPFVAHCLALNARQVETMFVSRAARERMASGAARAR